jgi:DNA-binding beta-propeller fold protein YncE
MLASPVGRLRDAAAAASLVALVGVAACTAPTVHSLAAPMVAEHAMPEEGPVPITGHMAPGLLPGMPALLDPHDLYAADRPGALAPFLANVTPRVYVPNSNGHTVSEIDPLTFRVIRTFDVGLNPQHVVPSWDLRTLWVNNDKGNTLTPISAITGEVGEPIPVHDPYNLYFSPNGRSAIVMASADKQIVFRDPHSMEIQKALDVPCDGVNHADFSPNGKYMIVTCEFTSELLKVDIEHQSLVGVLPLPGGMPQDIKISPDGTTWYVADMHKDGLYVLNGDSFQLTGFIPTGKGTHGLYISRDSRTMYVTNRDEGSISTFDFGTGEVTNKWWLPGGGSPDMGGLSVDGKELWLAGRYNRVVYVVDTQSGKLLHKIPVGSGPHGLCVWPQPGRYSLGHTGILR